MPLHYAARTLHLACVREDVTLVDSVIFSRHKTAYSHMPLIVLARFNLYRSDREPLLGNNIFRIFCCFDDENITLRTLYDIVERGLGGRLKISFVF